MKIRQGDAPSHSVLLRRPAYCTEAHIRRKNRGCPAGNEGSRIVRRDENPRQLLQSIIRAFRIAEMLAKEGELGVTEIDVRLGIDKSTAYRILATLREIGYVRQNPVNSKYSNTPKFSLLGGTGADMQQIRELAWPVLRSLSDRVGEAVNLGCLDGADIVYVERIQCDEMIQVNLPVGQRMPAYCSALGKAILAHMPRETVRKLFSGTSFVQFTERTVKSLEMLLAELEIIRANRFARDMEESHKGLSCLAAPVFLASGKVAAGISVSFPTFRHPDMKETERTIVPALRDAAAGISGELGYGERNYEPDRPATHPVPERKRLEE